MTREKEINIAASKYIEDNSMPDGEVAISDHKGSFIEGADWADANPKSPWISVKDKLPCNEKDLIVEIIKGVELRTKKVGVLSIDGYIDISYMYSLPPHGWHWNTNDTITHWFPLPKRPKK